MTRARFYHVSYMILMAYDIYNYLLSNNNSILLTYFLSIIIYNIRLIYFPIEAASNAGIAYTMSIAATSSMEEVVQAASCSLRFFQMYIWKGMNRNIIQQLVHRVDACGFKAILLTVDAPVMGNRLGEKRNNCSMTMLLKPDLR